MYESIPQRFSFVITPNELKKLIEISENENKIDDNPMRAGNLVIDVTRTDVIDAKKVTPQRLIANPQWEDITDVESI